ncbi:MAG: protein-export chaperone SecB [Legionellales bacterium]|nr:protein-export chaperone SecB [Legionellales bacterium]|tara:strand:- start:151 stop:633 length:483 start_codon:yes stop_codon:yes gene_type:complete
MTDQTTSNETTDSNAVDTNQPQFAIGHLYLKDASFEMTHPMHMLPAWEPNANIQMDFKHAEVAEGQYEVVLTVTAAVDSSDQKVFVAEIQQAGAFLIKNFSSEQVEHLLESYCPSVLLPYARQSLSTLITQGGFPPLFLSPVDFESQYQEKKAARATADA